MAEPHFLEIRPLIVVLASLLLVACGEKPQTATTRKADDKAWAAAPSSYSAQGYKGGDQAAWEQQMKSRAQAQNEYNRTSAP